MCKITLSERLKDPNQANETYGSRTVTMYFSHVNQPPEPKTVKQKDQIRLHKQIQLTRYRLVKTEHWNKHTVYLMHFFRLFRRQMLLPAPMADRAQRAAEGAGAQVPKVAPVLQVSLFAEVSLAGPSNAAMPVPDFLLA